MSRLPSLALRDGSEILVGYQISRWERNESYFPRETVLMTIDVNSKDRSYWLSLRLFLEWLAIGGKYRTDWAKRAYKSVRALHHQAKAKDWEQVLPREIVRWANAELDKEMSDQICCDNTRVARLGNTGQMRRYRRQQDRGCCGFADWVAVGPDGNRYALGFNFGH